MIDLVCKSGPITTYQCYQIFTKSKRLLQDHEKLQAVNEFASIPDPYTTPPVLVARKMILLALFVQYFRSQHSAALAGGLSSVMNNLVETASRLVTANEDLNACVEGVECIILEGTFQSNSGNLRSMTNRP